MIESDYKYCGIPWKKGGRDRDGIDCVGLVEMFLREQFGFRAKTVESPIESEDIDALCRKFLADARPEKDRGDVVFFEDRVLKKVLHVAIYLGDGKYLNITRGTESRIENGLTLLRRRRLEPAGSISPADADRLSGALNVSGLGIDWATLIVYLVVAIVLSVASYYLMPRPKLPKNSPLKGRYSGQDTLATVSNPEIPLPDLLGQVTIGGNNPFTSLIDKSQAVSNTALQAFNKVVILCGGPLSAIDTTNFNVKVNGIQFNNLYFSTQGISLNPAQTKAEAVDGSIGGGANIPSFTIYKGGHQINVPVDVRAQYDRNFPVYGFAGCAYLVFRCINSTKFPSFNVTTTCKGRLCRTFDASGFIQTQITGESLTGADGAKVRFKLAQSDIVDVTGLTVGGVSYTQISATNQAGNIYYLNKTKGYVEFMTAPVVSASILVTYKYYPRSWTQNPAMHLVYLLTEPIRGKGFDASRVDWGAAVTLRDFCDATVSWKNANGVTSGPRYTCNYAIDYRKTAQDHFRAILDACYSYLFLSNGKFVMKARTSASSVFSFTENNIIADTFSSTLTDRADRANRVHVFFHPSETYNAETEVVRDDQNDQRSRADRAGNLGIFDEVLKVPAIDNFPQAERFGEQVLREEVNANYTCEFKTNIRGIALEPGDVVDITHSSQPAWAGRLFRIESLEYDEEDRLQVKCTEYFGGAYI